MVVDTLSSLSRNFPAIERGAAYSSGALYGSASTHPWPGSKWDGLVAQTTVSPLGCEPAEISNSEVSRISLNRFFTSCRSESSRSEEHTSELQSRFDLVCRLLLE